MTVAVLRQQRSGLTIGDSALLGLLALVSVLATTWAVVAANWNDGMSVGFAVAAVAVLEATLIAGSSAGRLVALLAAPVLGVLVIVPLTLSGMPADGGQATVAHVIGRYAVALTTGVAGNDSWGFIVGFSAGIWLLAFWTTWVVVREHRGALALLPGYLVLASNVINANFDADRRAAAFPTVVALGASLALLARTELAALQRRWGRQRVVTLPGTRRRYTGVALVAAAAALVVGVALPPLTSADISGRIFHFNFADFGRGDGVGSGNGKGVGPGGTHPSTIGFSPNTTPGGTLVDDPRPVLTFTSDSGAVIYLRAVTDVGFDAGNWYPAEPSGAVGPVAEPGGVPLIRDRNPGDGGVSTFTRSVHVHVTVGSGGAESGGNRVLFPGEPDSIDSADRFGTAFGVTSSGQLLTVDRVVIDGGYGTNGTLSTTGTVPAATAAQLQTAGTQYPSWLRDDGYIDVGTKDRAQLNDIRALAQRWTAGLTNPYDRARALESHLRGAEFRYTLSPPTPPANQWSIHYFLFTSHAGYCQYYASSMGLMMRLLGVPTRLVSGYGEGTVDDSTSTAKSALHSVTTSDAHVWVESYFPQYGWIPFEPTPSTQYGVYDPIPRPGANLTGSPTAPPTPRASAPAPTPSPTQSAAPAAPVVATGPSVPPGVFAFALTAVALVFGVVLLLSWITRPRTLRALWRRVAILGRFLGVRRKSSETALDYAGRMVAALPPDGTSVLHPLGDRPAMGRRIRERTAEALTQIAVLSGKAEFSASGLTHQEAIRWRRAWVRVTRVLPVLLWRRLVRGGRVPAR